MRNILHKTIRQTGINRFEKGNVIMKKSIYFLILNFTFLIFNCSQNPSKPPEPVLQNRDTITVSIEQVTHRSLSLRLTKKLQVKSDRYVLNRIAGADTFAFAPFALSQKDTVFIDDNEGQGLGLDSDYSYFAYRIDSAGIARDTSNTITATTLAATSHDFTWTEYTLGSGELYDVWGTDENNVYAVGAVKFGDSTFGVIKWDGNEWKPELYIGGKQAIYGFAEDDIWIAGGTVWHYDGSFWKRVDAYSQNSQSFPLDQVLYDNTPYRSIWGTSSANLYFAGREGKIVHWDGEKAEMVSQINNGASIDDIYGLSESFILATGSKLAPPSAFLFFDGKTWTEFEGLNDQDLYNSVFAFTPKYYFVAGENIMGYFSDTWQRSLISSHPVIKVIRGNPNTGDLFAVGAFSSIFHHNGVKWKQYVQVENSSSSLFGLWVNEDHVFAVGYLENKALILIGKR
jgi:hypothetical protein